MTEEKNNIYKQNIPSAWMWREPYDVRLIHALIAQGVGIEFFYGFSNGIKSHSFEEMTSNEEITTEYN